MMQENMMTQKELMRIYNKLQKSFSVKINAISALQTNHYLNKLLKINKRTKNQNIGKIIDLIGMSNLNYKKYCRENNYYTDPFVNEKIRDAYIKLSRKSMKIQTKKKTVKNNPEKMEIEYNSDRGTYQVKYLENCQVKSVKEYNIQNIKNLGAKRKNVLKRLTQYNYGINIFNELGVNENNFYKVNPDILHIFLCEGKIDNAKMYIKEVLGGLPLKKPFSIKYVLNRNLEKGVFSKEENKRMKKMARADRISNQLVLVSDKRKKEIAKPKISAVEQVKRSIKIQNIMEKKKLNSVVAVEQKEPENKCKIYNIDRRNQNKEDDFYSKIDWVLPNRCKIYNIDRRNNIAYAVNAEKVADDNEREYR